MTGRMDGKVAIVTGATSGIGRATAILLAREGARVVATGRNEKAGKETEKMIARAGGEGRYLRQDVTSEESWQTVIDETLGAYGKLDAMVNNAGSFLVKPIGETTVDDWDQVWSINVDGVFLGTKLAMAAMKRNPAGGSIINVSSLMGLVGLPDAAAYCAAKGAVTSFSKAAALDGAADEPRVRVNSLHPGVIWTDMLVKQFGDDDEVKNFLIEETPLKRLGLAEDIANAVLYLASDASRYVTGSSLTIDGGRGCD
ncbi:MAG: glucose 1-dehydrogenase [Alphaproteobacteria bacterium]|nr:MAG: glucose 1-dehydrogenase [Alphaproteobacteria bacterium]